MIARFMLIFHAEYIAREPKVPLREMYGCIVFFPFGLSEHSLSVEYRAHRCDYKKYDHFYHGYRYSCRWICNVSTFFWPQQLPSTVQYVTASAKNRALWAFFVFVFWTPQERWRATVREILDYEVNLTGDIFLSAAFVSYLGAFTGPFRHMLSASWAVILRDKGIHVSDGYSLAKVGRGWPPAEILF